VATPSCRDLAFVSWSLTADSNPEDYTGCAPSLVIVMASPVTRCLQRAFGGRKKGWTPLTKQTPHYENNNACPATFDVPNHRLGASAAPCEVCQCLKHAALTTLWYPSEVSSGLRYLTCRIEISKAIPDREGPPRTSITLTDNDSHCSPYTCPTYSGRLDASLIRSQDHLAQSLDKAARSRECHINL
jgi:hypothetical protein